MHTILTSQGPHPSNEQQKSSPNQLLLAVHHPAPPNQHILWLTIHQIVPSDGISSSGETTQPAAATATAAATTTSRKKGDNKHWVPCGETNTVSETTIWQWTRMSQKFPCKPWSPCWLTSWPTTKSKRGKQGAAAPAVVLAVIHKANVWDLGAAWKTVVHPLDENLQKGHQIVWSCEVVGGGRSNS